MLEDREMIQRSKNIKEEVSACLTLFANIRVKLIKLDTFGNVKIYHYYYVD